MKPLKLGEGSLSSRSQSPAMSPHIVSKLWLFPHGCMVEPGDSGAFGGRLEVSGEGSGYSKFYGGSSFLGSFHINLWEGCGRFWKNCPINFLSPGPTYCHCWGYHLSFDVVLSSSLPAATSTWYWGSPKPSIFMHFRQWNMLKKDETSLAHWQDAWVGSIGKIFPKRPG